VAKKLKGVPTFIKDGRVGEIHNLNQKCIYAPVWYHMSRCTHLRCADNVYQKGENLQAAPAFVMSTEQTRVLSPDVQIHQIVVAVAVAVRSDDLQGKVYLWNIIKNCIYFKRYQLT
jgi:hypothetical protein